MEAKTTVSNQSRLGQENRTPSSKSLRSPAVLEVEGSGKFFIEQIATVGRAADSHVLLNLRSVSRHHARIFYEGGHYWIKDLGSANGTTVNGKKVNLQMLSDNDRIDFGEAKATFHVKGIPSGPVLLAQDPLEGSDADSRDGTPTGGLEGKIHQPAIGEQRIRELEFEVQRLRQEGAHKHEELEASRKKIETLQADQRGPGEHDYRENGITTASGQSSVEPENVFEENERLRRLVDQLERALADSNLRSNELQKRLDRTDRQPPDKKR